jgi:threonine/homoserine/homoserine lactone efflux protein
LLYTTWIIILDRVVKVFGYQILIFHGDYMDSASYWIIFLTAALLLNITPGPDIIFLISKTLSHGRKSGFATVLGLGTGAMIHTLFVSLGISVIITKSVMLFTIIKYVGALYLFYLGLRAFFCGGIKFKNEEKKRSQESFFNSFYQAVIIDVTNPKVALFFIAFLPQFYRNNGNSKIVQFLTLGLIIVLIGFAVESLIVVISDRIAGVLKRKPAFAKIMDNLLGTMFIALGVKLLFEKSR